MDTWYANGRTSSIKLIPRQQHHFEGRARQTSSLEDPILMLATPRPPNADLVAPRSFGEQFELSSRVCSSPLAF